MAPPATRSTTATPSPFSGANGNVLARAGVGAQSTSSGFTGGGTIGYNFSTQSLPFLNAFAGGFAGGGLVFGVEADAAYTDLNRNTAFGPNAAFGTRTDFVGTARGRLGLAFDRLMVYGTGGFAYGGIRDNVVIGGGPYYSGNNEKLQTGYAYGGGIEYALPTDVVPECLQLERRHAQGGVHPLRPRVTSRSASRRTPGRASTARNRVDGNLARVGLNFKFGSPVAPVVGPLLTASRRFSAVRNANSRGVPDGWVRALCSDPFSIPANKARSMTGKAIRAGFVP